MTVLQPATLVACPPPVSLNPDGTAGIVLPGLRAFDLTEEAGLALARRLLALWPVARSGWRTGLCSACRTGPRPVRAAGKFFGRCASCSSGGR